MTKPFEYLTLNNKLKAAGVDREARAKERPSDHAPTWIELDV